MTEPHHALTVDGEGEDSGGNEVHEIYVRLGAAPATALNEKDTLPCQQNESKDTLSCKSFQLSKKTHFRARKERKTRTFVQEKREREREDTHFRLSCFRVDLRKKTHFRVYLFYLMLMLMLC